MVNYNEIHGLVSTPKGDISKKKAKNTWSKNIRCNILVIG